MNTLTAPSRNCNRSLKKNSSTCKPACASRRSPTQSPRPALPPHQPRTPPAAALPVNALRSASVPAPFHSPPVTPPLPSRIPHQRLLPHRRLRGRHRAVPAGNVQFVPHPYGEASSDGGANLRADLVSLPSIRGDGVVGLHRTRRRLLDWENVVSVKEVVEESLAWLLLVVGLAAATTLGYLQGDASGFVRGVESTKMVQLTEDKDW